MLNQINHTMTGCISYITYSMYRSIYFRGAAWWFPYGNRICNVRFCFYLTVSL